MLAKIVTSIFEFAFRFIRILAIVITLSFVIYASLNLYFGVWTWEQLQQEAYDIFKYVIPGFLFSWWIYHSFIERVICFRNREKSKKVSADIKVAQKSGSGGSGKDSSTVGEAVLLTEYLIDKELNEMKEIEDVCYIYDFDKFKDVLTECGEIFLTADKRIINRNFTDLLRKNNAFIKPYYNRKQFDVTKHLRQWKYQNGKIVQDYNMKDGITPGGVPFLDLLYKYTMLYVQHSFVPNFILSNQSIIEKIDIDKKRIKKLYSKKYSQDYLKLKKRGPIPLPLRGVILETETAIFLGNVDKANESELKAINGIREFFTVARHILQDNTYYRSITQKTTRVMLNIRELFPNYMHVFRQQHKCTSPLRRFFLKMLCFFDRLNKFRVTIRSIMMKLLRFHVLNGERSLERISRRISYYIAKQKQLYNNGYIITYQGVYEDISEVGRSVKFPKLGVKLENNKGTLLYNAYGYKQYNRMSDSWGRYDTWYMNFIREEKEKDNPMHFNAVPNWETEKLNESDVEHLNYGPLYSMTQFMRDIKDDLESLKSKMFHVKTQNRKETSIPSFINLTDYELIDVAIDYGLRVETHKSTLGYYFYHLLTQSINDTYLNRSQMLIESGFDNLKYSEIRNLFEDLTVKNNIEIDLEKYPYKEWRRALESEVIKSWIAHKEI